MTQRLKNFYLEKVFPKLQEKFQRNFILDRESQESMNWLVENGYNVSQLVREFLKEKAKRAQAFLQYEKELENKNNQ